MPKVNDVIVLRDAKVRVIALCLVSYANLYLDSLSLARSKTNCAVLATTTSFIGLFTINTHKVSIMGIGMAPAAKALGNGLGRSF